MVVVVAMHFRGALAVVLGCLFGRQDKWSETGQRLGHLQELMLREEEKGGNIFQRSEFSHKVSLPSPHAVVWLYKGMECGRCFMAYKYH